MEGEEEQLRDRKCTGRPLNGFLDGSLVIVERVGCFRREEGWVF